MLSTQQLFLATELIKAASSMEMTGGGIMRGGLMHGGMGAKNVRKALIEKQQGNMPYQRLAATGKSMTKLFKPQNPYTAMTTGRMSELARVKSMYPALSTHEQTLAPLRARHAQPAGLTAPATTK